MKSNYKELGEYIELVSIINSDLYYDEVDVIGVSNNKEIIKTRANNEGRELNNFYVVAPNVFIYNSRTSRMGDKVGLGYNDSETSFITSFNNTVFRVKNEALLPMFLFMWFKRPEFDRYARFHSWGSSTEIFSWEEMCKMLLPIPHPDKQREIVKEYTTIQNRINLLQQLIQKMEESAQAIYKQWFVDFEFPNENGKPYKSNGGEMEFNEELEIDIPKGWEVGFFGDKTLTEIIKPGINKFEGNKIYLATSGVEGSYIIDYETKISYSNKPSRANMQPFVNSIWFAKMKNTKKNQLFLDIDKWNIENIVLSTGFFGVKPLLNSTCYIWTIVNSSFFDEEKNSLVNGTTMEAINIDGLKCIKHLIPTQQLIDQFGMTTVPIYRLSSLYKKEVRKLTQARDLLLSKLASINN